MKQSVRLLIATVALLAGTAAQAAVVYDATLNFQTASNPGSVWSYGYSAGPDTSYSFTAFDTASTLGGTIGWSASTHNSYGTPGIWINNSGSTLYGAAAGQLSLHAGPVANGDATILRFTAATAGDYSVAGQFYAGDVGTQSGAVIYNSDTATPIYYIGNTTDTSTFSFTKHLAAGQTLDFVVGNNGSFYNGTTPITVSISAVPEPESYAMMLAGLGLMGLIAARKRQA